MGATANDLLEKLSDIKQLLADNKIAEAAKAVEEFEELYKAASADVKSEVDSQK